MNNCLIESARASAPDPLTGLFTDASTRNGVQRLALSGATLHEIGRAGYDAYGSFA
ncbi:MAG: hypothetical protein ABR591_11140 [Candidatus Velthaea sp.]